MLISFVRPGIDYEFTSSTGGLEECFGVNEIVLNNSGVDASVSYPPSAYNTVSTEYRIACTWALHEDGRDVENLTMHAIITYRVLEDPDEERIEEERDDGSTITAEKLNGFDFGFCYIEAQPEPITPPGSIQLHIVESSHACETRNSNFRLWFSTTVQSVDLPKVTEAAGQVLQETFRR